MNLKYIVISLVLSSYIPSAIATKLCAAGESGLAMSPAGKSTSSNSIVEKVQPAGFEKEYAAFFKKYPMSEEKKELIRSAVIQYNNALGAIFRKARLERWDLGKLLDHVEKSDRAHRFEAELKEPLGSKVFEALVFYRDTGPERELACTIAAQMEAAGCGIDADKLEKFVRIFKNCGVMPAPASTKARNPATVEAEARRFAKAEEKVIKAAAKFLSSQQKRALKQIWSSMSDYSDNKGTDPAKLARMKKIWMRSCPGIARKNLSAISVPFSQNIRWPRRKKL